MQESAGYFVTYLHQDNYLQPQNATTASTHICPVCAGIAATVRLKRSRLQRLITQKKHYFCRQCKTDFWVTD